MLFLLIGTILFLVLVSWLSMKPFYWYNKGIPCDIPIPFIGSVFGILFSSYNTYWSHEYKRMSKYGSLYGFHTFGKRTLLVTDPEMLKEVLINQYDNFSSRGIHTNPSYDPVARSNFFASGNEWKRLRSKITPFFSPSKLKYSVELMKINIEEYSKALEKFAENKQACNINEYSLRLSTDVIVNTVFGIEPDSFKNPDSYFFALQQEMFGPSFVLRILLGAAAPFLYDLFQVTIIPSSTTNKLKQFVEDVINKRKENNYTRQDFIQVMMETVERESNSPSNFTIEDATSQCIVMYLGGTETTGNFISCLLHELSYHQDIQNKVREEINRVLAETDDGKFTYDLHKKFTYTNMAIDECLRLYPIVTVATRSCTRETRIGDIDIDVGTDIFVPIMPMQRDSKFYPEPEKFIPERFINNNEDNDYNNAVYMPFGLGPKKCIGWKLALLEILNTLSVIIPKYRFSPSEKSVNPIRFSSKPTLNPDGGIWLNIEKI